MEHFDVYLIKYANSILKKHKTTNLMINIFLPYEQKCLFSLVYCYFRWLDDQIDDKLNNFQSKLAVLKRSNLIICKKTIIKNPNTPERCLLQVLNYSDQKELNLRLPCKQMLTSIRLDNKRIDKIPTKRLYKILQTLRVSAYLNAIRVCLKLPIMKTNEIPAYGIACDEIHILRDFKDDFNAGIFNFSQEEVVKYGLNINKPFDHKTWKTWFFDKHKNVKKLIKMGIKELTVKPDKYSLICTFNFTRYSLTWLKIKFINN